jgi:hypothetical protein
MVTPRPIAADLAISESSINMPPAILRVLFGEVLALHVTWNTLHACPPDIATGMYAARAIACAFTAV